MRPRLTVFLVSLPAIALFASISNSAQPDLPTLSSTQAGVTVRATPRALSGGTWEFDLVFDTHTQALTDDLNKTAVLVADGDTTYSPVKWQGDPPGGHHRKGTLQFSTVSPVPASIELRIKRAGEANPRSFRWKLK